MHTHILSPVSHPLNLVPARQIEANLPVQPRPIPARHLGYLFVACGSEVAGLLSVLSAAGVPWVGTLLSSTKSLHSQEEN